MSGSAVDFDVDDRGGVTVVVDGYPQSHVQLDDPGLLAFEYVDHLAAAIDVLAPGPLRITHIGGAGMTLARYVASARPGSAQIVLEPDAELTAAVRARLPLPRGPRIRVRAVDGRAGLPGLAAGSADVVVLDAFAQGVVPGELTSIEGLAAIRRVLADPGVLVANLPDAPGRGYVDRVVATAGAAGLDPVMVIATHDVIKGKRFGNHVLVAATTPQAIDDAALRRRLLRSPFPTGAVEAAGLRQRAHGIPALTDAAPLPSPPPPDAWLSRRRPPATPRGGRRRGRPG